MRQGNFIDIHYRGMVVLELGEICLDSSERIMQASSL